MIITIIMKTTKMIIINKNNNTWQNVLQYNSVTGGLGRRWIDNCQNAASLINVVYRTLGSPLVTLRCLFRRNFVCLAVFNALPQKLQNWL